MKSEKILQVEGLTKEFGGLTAVSNVNFNVEKGEIFGLIGPNGAGKTTIFNLITGIFPPTKGSVIFGDHEIAGVKPHTIAQKGIARTFQNIKLFGKQTVLENVLTVSQVQADYGLLDGFLRTAKCRKQEKELMEISVDIINRVGIAKYESTQAGNLSYGMQRRVEIARALALKPKLLLLDEPAAGMNEDESYELVRLINEIRAEFDLSIIVIDHHMDLIMDLCHKVAVLNFGQMIAHGTTDEIQNNPMVIEAYLGVDEE